MNDGMYTFKVQGQVHHYMPTLYPTDNQSRFLQLHDTENQVKSQLQCVALNP